MKKCIKENKNRFIMLILAFAFQSLVYFISKFFQRTPIYLGSVIDSKIPFISYFVIFYFIWYFLLFLVPLLLLKYDKEVFDRYIVVSIIYSIIEGIIFISFPTTMNRAPLVVDGIFTWLVDIVYKLDMPVCNLFPSAHCAFSMLFVMAIIDVKGFKGNYKLFIIVISILVILSTVFIKQHVVIDIVGSLIIVPIYYIVKRKKVNLEKSGIYAKIFC